MQAEPDGKGKSILKVFLSVSRYAFNYPTHT